MSVSTPVMIMSLKERKYRLRYGQDMRYGLPLPRLKPSSMYMQRAKANETRNYLSYNLYEYSLRANRHIHEPSPLMRTTGRWEKNWLWSTRATHTNNQHERCVLSVCKTSSWQPCNLLWRIPHTYQERVEQRRDQRSSCKRHDSTMQWPRRKCSDWIILSQMSAAQYCDTTYLIHLPTGNLCKARFCGNSKRR